ncbi:MAG: DUF4097 family beta strand repeat protein [Candidatus Krumholzibacteriota bacterium]|nr:DUF4097 family beta strand repeat protein [Candidatus Krumholzibacteriota bacterium]
MKRHGTFLLTCLLVSLFALPASAGDIKKHFHEEFKVDRDTRLRLKHGDGNVTIRNWNKDTLDVEVRYHASHKHLGSGKERDFTVKFSEKNGYIEVVGKETSPGFLGFQVFILKEYTYTIYAPSYLDLDLDGEDGDIYIEGWKGDIECQTDDGDVDLFDVRNARTRIKFEDGDINIEEYEGTLTLIGDDGKIGITDSRVTDCNIQGEDGDVKIKNSEGNFEIEVDDGQITLYKLLSHRLDIRSSDGDVDIELLQVEEIDLDVLTDDGDVTVMLEPDISLAFSVDVEDGRIRVDLPGAEKIRKGEHWFSGILRDGKGKISIRTQGGSVTLKEIR